MPLVAFTSPPELYTMVGLCHLRWSLSARGLLAATTPVFGHNLDTALNLFPFLSSAFPPVPHVHPPFPRNLALSPAANCLTIHSVVFLSSERGLKG